MDLEHWTQDFLDNVQAVFSCYQLWNDPTHAVFRLSLICRLYWAAIISETISLILSFVSLPICRLYLAAINSERISLTLSFVSLPISGCTKPNHSLSKQLADCKFSISMIGVTHKDASKFKLQHSDKCDIWAGEGGQWFFKLKKGHSYSFQKPFCSVAQSVVRSPLDGTLAYANGAVPAEHSQTVTDTRSTGSSSLSIYIP